MIAFLFKIWGLAKPYRLRLWLGVFMGILAGLAQATMLATIKLVYSIVFPTAATDEKVPKVPKHLPRFVLDWIDSGQHWLASAREALVQGAHNHPERVFWLVALIPAVVLLRGVVSYLNIYFLQWVAIRTVTDLRIRLFEHLMNLSAGFFTRANSGELISRITNDTNVLQGIISNATVVVVKDPATLVCLFVYLMWQDPGLTLMSLVVLPLCVIPIAVFGRKVRKSAGSIQTQFSELTNVMSESFTGNRIIKAYNLEGTVIDQFRQTAKRLIGHYMRIVRAMEIPGPLTEFFGAIGASLVILYLYRHNQGATDGSDFIGLIGGLFLMYSPIKNLGRLHNTLEQAKAASERVFELLGTEKSIPEPTTPKLLKAAGAEIQFDNVFFNYDEKEILHGINLTVKPGQMVALVGPSGSGKTTITNLLLRFYDPLKGSVKIGGLDLREVATLDLRKQIAVVTQETVLFNDTIRRNIELGRPGAANSEIETAAKHAHAQAFILDKTDGYETLIGEKGVMLSGGQRQRLAIARAILKNAPILVLDEATSSLDSESERAVQAALDELMKGRTTICIAHRLSTIQKADLIVVLEAGHIVETGTHSELLARDSLYRKLHQLQLRPEMKALVTGGAGFIGSHLAEALCRRGAQVVVLDNLSLGKTANLAWKRPGDALELVQGDIADESLVRQLIAGCDCVFHEAALPSVPRSVAEPIQSNAHNLNATLQLLVLARDAKVKRFLFASSSSIYGDSDAPAKHEQLPPNPLSPYALQKYGAEKYGQLFFRLYGLPTVALRYFNVFGPRQAFDSPYSGVIAKFCTGMLKGQAPVIFGDGSQSRDFTHIENVVQANLLAAEAPAEKVAGRVFNIAGGQSISLLQLVADLNHLTRQSLTPRFEPPRVGDVHSSLADISAARDALGYQMKIGWAEGLERTLDFYQT